MRSQRGNQMTTHYNKDRCSIELGQYFCDHMDAMTREGLHEKTDIAVELAYRDKRIDVLQSKREASKKLEAKAKEFVEKLRANQTDIDLEAKALIAENLWELYD